MQPQSWDSIVEVRVAGIGGSPKDGSGAALVRSIFNGRVVVIVALPSSDNDNNHREGKEGISKEVVDDLVLSMIQESIWPATMRLDW